MLLLRQLCVDSYYQINYYRNKDSFDIFDSVAITIYWILPNLIRISLSLNCQVKDRSSLSFTQILDTSVPSEWLQSTV